MAYTRNIDVNDPADTDEAKYGAQEIRESKVDWQERFLSIVNNIDTDPLTFKSYKIKDDAIALEFEDSGESTPAGKFRLLIDADVVKLQGRNVGDTNWEDILTFYRPANEQAVLLSGDAPVVYLTDTGETTPEGKFRILNDGDFLYFQGRNAADDGWESILKLERAADGGKMTAKSGYTPSADEDLITKGYVGGLGFNGLKFLSSPTNKINWNAAQTWADVDISGDTGDDTAKAALVVMQLTFGTAASDLTAQMEARARKNGSSDTANLPRVRAYCASFLGSGSAWKANTIYNTIMAIVELDGSEIFEVDLTTVGGTPSSIAFKVDLVGYFV